MRRLWIVALTIAMLVAVTLPAAAAPKGKPPKDTGTLYEVTFTRVGEDGLDTGCGASLIMRGEKGLLVADGSEGTSDPLVGVVARVAWDRFYGPGASGGDSLTGCHTRAELGYRSGLLWISPEAMLWIFDYYTETETIVRGRKTFEQVVATEYLRLTNTELLSIPDWTSGLDTSVSAEFVLQRWLRDEDNPEAGWTTFGSTTMEFAIAITPLD